MRWRWGFALLPPGTISELSVLDALILTRLGLLESHD